MWTAFWTVLLSALLLTHAQDSAEPISRELADETNDFSLELFKEELDESPGNVVISPISVSSLLAILQQGAGGETLTQMTKVLHASPEQSRQGYSLLTRNLRANQGNETLEFANGAFLQNGYNVLANIQDIMKNDFQSTMENVDFAQADAAAAEINAWVAEHTHDRIKDLISPGSLSSDTRLVLTNAIYFKDIWETTFDVESTFSQAFYAGEDAAMSQVQMMHIAEKFPAGRLGSLDSQWVALPFQGGRFSMLLVVPNEVNGVRSLVTNMQNQDLSQLIQSISDTEPQKLQLSLPKFKIASKMDLVQPLSKLGMTDIFGTSADLSGISGESLYVSGVIQKAEIEVDEQGATASAATGVIVGTTSVGPQIMKIVADHPFLAFIVDGLNGVPLFACRVSDPNAS